MAIQKKFLTNLGFLILVNLLIKPFYVLGIDAEVQNVVGAEDYGNYFAILNFSFLFNILNDLGVTNFNNRSIARDPNLLDSHFPRLLSLRLILLLGYGLFTLLSGILVGYDMNQLFVLSFLALNQGLVAGIFYLRSNLSGLHLFKEDSLISVLDRALMIIFCGTLLWTDIRGEDFSIHDFVYAQTVSYALSFLAAFVLVRRRVTKFRFHWSPEFWKDILIQSAPYALFILLMSIYHRVDSVMMERILPDGDLQSGIYAQGYRFLDVLNNFSFLFAILLFPIFSKMLKEKEDVRELLDLSFRILLSLVLIVVLTCYTFKVDIMSWRYAAHVDASAHCFGLLIFTALAHSTTHIFGTLLTAAGKLKILNIIGFLGVIGSIGLNYWLAPRFLAYGSAMANLSTNAVLAILYVLSVQQVFGFSLSWSVLFRVLMLSGILYAVGFFAHFMPGNWLLNALLMGAIGLVSAMLLRLIDVKGLQAILKES